MSYGYYFEPDYYVLAAVLGRSWLRIWWQPGTHQQEFHLPAIRIWLASSNDQLALPFMRSTSLPRPAGSRRSWFAAASTFQQVGWVLNLLRQQLDVPGLSRPLGCVSLSYPPGRTIPYHRPGSGNHISGHYQPMNYRQNEIRWMVVGDLFLNRSRR